MADILVSKEDIVRGLVELGLHPASVVLVHSSLSSFGRVEGGADTVVNALLEALGKDGTLVVPTFNASPGEFDPSKTPSTTGAITEAVRTRPQAVRSHHPTHSIAAIGPLAADIVEGHERVSAFGRGSPLFKLLQVRGSVLMLGTNHTSNSMVHVAEEIAGVGYLDRSQPVKLISPSGKTTTKWIRRPGCSMGFGEIEETLQEGDAIVETMIGKCRARLVTARAIVDAALEALKLDPEALLCDRPDCGSCAEARAILAALQVEAQEQEIIELAEQDERTVRLIEKQLSGSVTFFDPDGYEHSPN
jgi:aminoglycoside 3-N-acetyltransferase